MREWLRKLCLLNSRSKYFVLRNGISREKMSALLRDFAVLDVVASSSKLTKKDAGKLSHKIKIAAWKRLKLYAHWIREKA